MASNLGFINQIFSRTVSLIKTQISSIAKWTIKAQTFANTTSQKIQEKISTYIRALTSSPRSKQDYWKIGGTYFSKKFVVTIIAAIGAIVMLFTSFIYPMIDGKLWYSKIYTDRTKYDFFTGKAKIYDPTKNLIYQGHVLNGRAEGYGVQYTLLGKLVYKGNFHQDKYSGNGELYDENENFIYKGNFENNKYHGQGQQFNSFGATIYTGGFESGVRSGRGTEFDPKSNLKIFFGDHVNGLREGRGIEFASDGETILYEGDFKENKYDGTGKQYLENHLIYSGEFKEGVYDGSGSFYDKVSGVIKYIGEFKNGFFEGYGKLFNIKNLKLIYDGEFLKGKRHGEGTSFDILGTQIYSGEYKDDGINFIGTLSFPIDKIKTNFGEPSLQNIIDDKLFVYYSSLGVVMIFSYNEKNIYVCKKIIINPKIEFMGITTKSTANDCTSIMGIPYSSIKFSITQEISTAFKFLEVSVPQLGFLETNKHIFDSYFIRFYFTTERTETKAIEIGET